MKTKILEKIYNLVSEEFDIDFKNGGRKEDEVIARDFYYALCNENLRSGRFKTPFVTIGKFVNRDHSSVVTGCKRIDNILFNNKDLEPVYTKLNSLTLKYKLSLENETNVLDTDLIKKQKAKVESARLKYEKEVKILNILLK